MQAEFLRELEIAFIVRRNAHDRARAVAHQDVVGDPDWNPFLVHRIHRERARERAGLLPGQVGAFEVGFRGDFGPIGFDRLPLLVGRDLIDQGIFRSDDHVGRAVERVGSRRED